MEIYSTESKNKFSKFQISTKSSNPRIEGRVRVRVKVRVRVRAGLRLG